MGVRTAFGKVSTAFVQIWAEDRFKHAAFMLSESITPNHLRMLAANDHTTFTEMLEAVGYGGLKATPNAGTNYLQQCSTEHLLGLLDEVVPEHAAVLREHPKLAKQVADGLRAMVTPRP